jgi:large subunit ribosomal protein L25
MKTLELKGQARTSLGSTDAKSARLSGKVPGVLYQGKSEPVHFYTDALDMGKLLGSPDTYIIHLDIDGVVRKAVLRETQFHPVSDDLIHADFYGVSDDKPFEVSLPIQFNGTSKGVLAGGTLVKKMRRLKVKGTIATLPDHIDINIAHLELGKTIKVKDLNLANINITTPSSAALVTIDIPRSLRGDKAASADSGKK